MRLNELTSAEVPGVRAIPPNPQQIEISGLAYDSRQVAPGTLFFCVKGYRRDGHEFAAGAVADGAVALVTERPLGLGVPEVLVHSSRAAMGPLAARFHDDPTASLEVVGVTGTNGKTTTAYLIRALLEAAGRPCGLLGTIASVIGGDERPAARTTPEAIDLQADFRAMLDGGERCCAMEVSSHALALERTGAVRFAAGVFTNLTQDHLDFHPTMEDYFLAKRLLFAPGEPARAPGFSVVNIDDPYGRRLAAELEGAVTFAIDGDGDYSAHEVQVDLSGSRFQLSVRGGEARPVALPLPGRFNVSNALAALAVTHGLGVELDTLVAALEQGARVRGRLEPVEEGQSFAVLVDYAHTPDSLQNVLSAARELGEGRVICVFGAGGDRDRGKRPLMGEAGARLADLLFVTSDNPRSEDPQAIIAEIMDGARGVGGAGPIEVEVDRRAAIEHAVASAHPGDVLVIAGKGHEQGQEFADGVKVPFDDVTVAREALRAQAA